MKPLLALPIIMLLSLLFYFRSQPALLTIQKTLTTKEKTDNGNGVRKEFTVQAMTFIREHKFNSSVCFLIDMHMPSGKKRFLVWDLKNDKLLFSGLVAHGSCNYAFLEKARFSNVRGCGCSSIGKYRIGCAYPGRFGKAFKLHGLDSTNSEAFHRNIVLHAYSCIPNEESEAPICNSLGCAMVSYAFLKKLTPIIEHSNKPILLWILP